MAIKQTLDVINEMERAGVIGRYAIGGAVAAYNYVEPALTEDLDIFIAMERPGPLVTLDPIYSYLRDRGYASFSKEGVVIGGWPVQFLPIVDALDSEALKEATAVEIETKDGRVATRIFTAEHLVGLALRVGRPKDLLRVAQFLEEKAINLSKLKAVLDRHGLAEKWRGFCSRSGIADPLAAK